MRFITNFLIDRSKQPEGSDAEFKGSRDGPIPCGFTVELITLGDLKTYLERNGSTIATIQFKPTGYHLVVSDPVDVN